MELKLRFICAEVADAVRVLDLVTERLRFLASLGDNGSGLDTWPIQDHAVTGDVSIAWQVRS